MVKVRDQELVASLPENIWSGPSWTPGTQAIQALPTANASARCRFSPRSGDDAMRAKHAPDTERVLWDVAGDYATEALTIAPQAKDDADYGTSLFRANMVAGVAALVGGNKTAAV